MATQSICPFEQNSFDRCWMLEVDDILDDPVRAVREMVRVTRPGGHICLLLHESDATIITPAGDPMTRRLLDFVSEHELPHPSGIEMVSILKSLGTTIETVEGLFSHSYGFGSFGEFADDFAFVKALFLDEWLADAVAAGVLTSEKAQQWLADQEAHASEGRFGLGFPLFRVKASKQ